MLHDTMDGGGKLTALSALALQLKPDEGAGAAAAADSTSGTSGHIPSGHDNDDHPHLPPPAKRARVDDNNNYYTANGGMGAICTANFPYDKTDADNSAPNGPAHHAGNASPAGTNLLRRPSSSQPPPFPTTALPTLPRDGKLLLLDMEGCITSMDYARKCHEEYVRKHLPGYLDASAVGMFVETFSDLDLKRSVRRMERQMPPNLWEEAKRGGDRNGNNSDDNDNRAVLQRCIEVQLRHNVQTDELLSIQGQIWKAGRRKPTSNSNNSAVTTEELEGHIYPDFIPVLRLCRTMGLPVCLYAHPSVKEQMQIMRLSSQGDLTPYISGYFDTGCGDNTATTAGSNSTTSSSSSSSPSPSSSIGPKTDANSYRKIAQRMNVDIRDVVVLSVDEKELEAARAAGAKAVMRRRPANWSDPMDGSEQRFPVCCMMMQLFQMQSN